MRQLLKICQKNTVFELSWCLLRLEGGDFGQKRCKGGCSNVSGTK